jgi:hypothetical protein
MANLENSPSAIHHLRGQPGLRDRVLTQVLCVVGSTWVGSAWADSTGVRNSWVGVAHANGLGLAAGTG